MPLLITLLAGAIFGAGLVVSGMSNPKKVLGFLDIGAMSTGGWDPTLLMVFIGALPVMFAAYRRKAPNPGSPIRSKFQRPAPSTARW